MQGAGMVILLWAIAYLLGSISSALLICRFFNLPDPRTQGSQNPGATNVLRLAGLPYATMVLIFDALKGFIPVIFAMRCHMSPFACAMTAFFAVIGHMYPIFFHFRGGKGVATTMGALLALHFILGVMVLMTWFVVVGLTRFSSLAAIVAIGLAPFYGIWLIRNLEAFSPLFLMMIFVLYQHRQNMFRLIDGIEPKMFSLPLTPTPSPSEQIKKAPSSRRHKKRKKKS